MKLSLYICSFFYFFSLKSNKNRKTHTRKNFHYRSGCHILFRPKKTYEEYAGGSKSSGKVPGQPFDQWQKDDRRRWCFPSFLKACSLKTMNSTTMRWLEGQTQIRSKMTKPERAWVSDSNVKRYISLEI